MPWSPTELLSGVYDRLKAKKQAGAGTLEWFKSSRFSAGQIGLIVDEAIICNVNVCGNESENAA